MATSRDYLDYILEQLGTLDGITARAMMGEYIIYCKGKIAAYVCDNRLLVKPVASAKRLLPDAPQELPYDGAKPMLLVEDIDNRELLTELFELMYDELPEPQKKKRDK